MKLTNISLAVLVALGLVACGGSDDNKNQTTDNQNAGHQTGGNGGAGGAGTPPTPPTPPKGDDSKTVKDPDNRAAALEVEKRYETNTAVAKSIYANRSGISTLAGYTGTTYNAGSVSTPDLLRGASAINYLNEGWVSNSGTIRINPLQTYARGASGAFYRVIGVYNNGVLVNWDQATPSSTFAVIDPDPNNGTNPLFVPAGEFSNPRSIPATNIFYVPNAALAPNGKQVNQGAVVSTAANFYSIPNPGPGSARADISGLGTINIDPNLLALNRNSQNALSNAAAYDISRSQVAPASVTVGGKNYTFDTSSSSSNSFKLDLGIENKEEIQSVPVKFNYTIYDGKGTSTLADDSTAFRSTDAGELRVYNLNYSLALLEVNDAAAKDSNNVNAAPRNGLGFGGGPNGGIVSGYIQGYGNISGNGSNGRYGPYQITGFQTQALPLNGRATYKGQSFGVNSKGVIDLSVDFGEERAAIGGSVTKRTTVDGKQALPDMQLKNIYLSQPSQYSVTGSVGLDSNNSNPVVSDGVVDLGGQTNWGTWAVQLYGPNAENAAGVIAQGPNQGSNLNRVVEVFNSARTDINPKSLNNPK